MADHMARFQEFLRDLRGLLTDVDDCYGAGLNHQVERDMMDLERAGYNLLESAEDLANER